MGHCGVDESVEHAGRESLPTRRRLDGDHEFVGWGVLEQEADGTRVDGVDDEIVVVEGGEDQDRRGVWLRSNVRGGRDAVATRHSDVHQDDITRRRSDNGHGIDTVSRLADDLDPVPSVQQEPQPGADQLLIIDQHDPGRTQPWHGSTALTTNPDPSGPAVSDPTASRARSARPANP